jgi:chromosome segregation ATPase
LLNVPAPRSAVPSNLFAGTLDDLREKLAALEEEVQLDEEAARELAEQLEELRREAAAGQSLEATYEAIGELGERLEDEAREAREAAERAAESLARASASARDDPAQAREDLDAALAEMVSAGLSVDLSKELAHDLGLEAFDGIELPEGLELDAAGLAELSEEMLAELARTLQELADAGLLDGLDLSAFGELGELGELGDLADLDLSAFELCEKCKAGEP